MTRPNMQVCTYLTQLLAVHGLAVLVSLGLLAVGYSVASHRVPDQICVGYTSGGREDGEGLNRSALIMGMSAMAAGVFSVLGGSSGFGGAFKKRQRLVQAAQVLFGIAILLGVISIISGFLTSFNGCLDYSCANETICYRSDALVEEGAGANRPAPLDEVTEQLVQTGVRSMCSPDDNHTDCRDVNFEYICKPAYDSLCEWDGKPLPCFIVTFVSLVFMSCACCYECGAAERLDLRADSITGVTVLQSQGATIVGQPAGS